MVNVKPRPLYPRESPSTHCIGGRVGPRAVWMGTEKLAPTGIRSPNRRARSQSLYRLRYPGPPRRVCPRENTRHPLYRRLCGLVACLWRVREISLPIGFRTSDRPAHGGSLYRAISTARFERSTSRIQAQGSTATSVCPIHPTHFVNIPPKPAKIS